MFRLEDFLKRNPDLQFPHRHNFYQMLYILDGIGNHTIDFTKYSINKRQLYFLKPGQIHEWQFQGQVKGFIINFNKAFFSSFLLNANYLNEFVFLQSYSKTDVIELTNPKVAFEVEKILQELLNEYDNANDYNEDIIRVQLLKLFISLNRKQKSIAKKSISKINLTLYHTFETLVEENFSEMKLPKLYAEKLHITPNHLNHICNEVKGIAAGDIIRDRVILEAKRLLINSALHINEIAWELNFQDNSYFNKFFKKHTGITPEEFRKTHA
jgi:AraC family transcriptional regulator, transcriptional activator of pobA